MHLSYSISQFSLLLVKIFRLRTIRYPFASSSLHPGLLGEHAHGLRVRETSEAEVELMACGQAAQDPLRLEVCISQQVAHLARATTLGVNAWRLVEELLHVQAARQGWHAEEALGFPRVRWHVSRGPGPLAGC